MSTQIAVRLEPRELAVLDAEVAAGRAQNRSDAVRKSIAYLQRKIRYQQDAVILEKLSANGESLYPDIDGFKPATDWDTF